MKKFKIALCFLDEEDNVVVKRCLESNWSVDLEKDIKDFFNIHIKDEIAKVLMDGVKLELNLEVIKEMLEKLKEKGD